MQGAINLFGTTRTCGGGRAMHFVTGGAYNGKAKWVKKHDRLDIDHVQWISAYRDEPLPLHFQKIRLCYKELKPGLKGMLLIKKLQSIRMKWQEIIGEWRIWEEEKNDRHLILIGADITKGIVPIEVENRIWRDATGWVFQDIVASFKSCGYHLVWNQQQLK